MATDQWSDTICILMLMKLISGLFIRHGAIYATVPLKRIGNLHIAEPEHVTWMSDETFFPLKTRDPDEQNQLPAMKVLSSDLLVCSSVWSLLFSLCIN